jgi:hypothetical protein
MIKFNNYRKIPYLFLVFFLFLPCKSSISSSITREDYFDVARTIASKPHGKELALKNIMRDHTGENPNKSYFYSKEQIDNMIDAAVSNPSYHDFSKSTGRLMIIKDFEENIGVHRTPGGESINSNRLTLFFGDTEKVINNGKPWNGKLGVLLTGFPDNPYRQY